MHFDDNDNNHINSLYSVAGTESEPCHNFNYICKTLHLRCLTEF